MRDAHESATDCIRIRTCLRKRMPETRLGDMNDFEMALMKRNCSKLESQSSASPSKSRDKDEAISKPKQTLADGKLQSGSPICSPTCSPSVRQQTLFHYALEGEDGMAS